MKKLQNIGFAGAAAAALLGLTGAVPTANAQLISITSGNFTIFADGYSSSTIDPNSSSPTVSAPGSTLVTRNPGDPVVPAGTKEDTWGIFQITSITQGTNPATPVFTDNLGVEYWGIFYNSYDFNSGLTPFGNVEFAARGLKLDIYRIPVLDSNDSKWQNVFTTPSAGFERIGQSGYQGITDAPGASLALSSTLNGDLGSSFNVVQKTTNATGSLNVGFNSLFGGPGALGPLTFSLGGNTSAPPVGWTVKFGGPIDGAFVAVPEPSTYSLMGVCALAGVIAVRRWKKRALQS